MARIYPLHGASHDATQALLPWYVNGTLAPEEIARVEAHLSECSECRADAEAEHGLARSVAALPLGVEHGWSAMKQRLASDEAPPAPRLRTSRFLRRRVTIGWAIAGPVAAAAAVALMFTFLPLRPPVEQTYRALGSPSDSARGNLVVLFRPDTTERQMRLVLTANDARLVDGPTAAGAYVLHVEDAQRERALRGLRRSGEITLAEPIDPAELR